MLTALCVSGVHIAISMATVGLVFTLLFYGNLESVITLVGLTVWSNMAHYSMSMIPLFVFMGELIRVSDLGKESYDCIYKWLSKLKGGLAITTVWTCAVFGSITGSTAGAIAAVGGIAVPEMKRHGYSKELRTGSIASSGSLAHLIPPSIAAMFFGVMTSASVGKLFIAGIVPGIILSILFSVAVYIMVSLKPRIAPLTGESYSFREKVVSLKKPMPLVVMFLVMFGGIYMGVFSPTEAAAMGCCLTMVMVVVMKRLTWQRFRDAMAETLRITAFIMLLISGAMLFSQSIALTGLPPFLGKMMTNLGPNPLLVIFAIVCVVVILGMFLDMFGLMVLTVPLFSPIVIQLGFDIIWYGVFTVVLLEIALITPPVAAHIYIAQSLDDEATTMDVARGILPFLACEVILIVLLIFFPWIALWLPAQMVR
jgi:tripartite ATP-independent transporter DctM subunit